MTKDEAIEIRKKVQNRLTQLDTLDNTPANLAEKIRLDSYSLILDMFIELPEEEYKKVSEQLKAMYNETVDMLKILVNASAGKDVKNIEIKSETSLAIADQFLPFIKERVKKIRYKTKCKQIELITV